SFPFATAGNATKVLADPINPQAAFVTFTGYAAGAHIARTTDLGATWTDVSGDFPQQPVNTMEVDPQFPGEWYIGTDVGVWTSTNGGVNWTPFDVGLPNAVVLDLEIRDAARKLVAGTYGRGAFEAALSGSVTGVTTGDTPAPLNLMLDPPRPNPAVGRTMLRFAARSGESVTLDIYDVAGRRVANLADQASGDGIIRGVPWITDDVPAGVYFAVLRAGADQASRKIIVAK
ncbi:MAG: T9SS type A sorting domain-containing protein, partial [Gemmatimonadetes bacterium]|nr:T9SS type A sorting domain-containing protein [Gemmatimonadota bacterium]